MPRPSRKASELEPISPEEDAAVTAAAETDPDNPPWDDEVLARMRPVREVAPELIDMAKGHASGADARTVAVEIRLSADVLERFRATGPDWQARIDQTLRKALETSDLVTPK